jgi:hypothetical protein
LFDAYQYLMEPIVRIVLGLFRGGGPQRVLNLRSGGVVEALSQQPGERLGCDSNGVQLFCERGGRKIILRELDRFRYPFKPINDRL